MKKYNLFEFYEKFGINIGEKLPNILQSNDDIMRYIDSHDFLSLKNCNEFDFSTDDYYYFFVSLKFNNIEINQIIFNFIEDKKDLQNTFIKISSYFNDETVNKFYNLMKLKNNQKN